MNGQSAHKFIMQNRELVSLPEIVIELNQLANNPRSTLADICELIGKDPALIIRLLKIVNSPFYGFPSQVDTLSQAVTIIGTQQLRNLVLSTELINKFPVIPAGLASIESFWSHSLYCAVAAQHIAMYRQLPCPERYFIAGILHDIGKMVMYLAMPEDSIKAMEKVDPERANILEVEREIFGFDHAMVGAELLWHWRLPESIIEPVACHHSPDDANIFKQESSTVNIANKLSNSFYPIVLKHKSLPDEASLLHEYFDEMEFSEIKSLLDDIHQQWESSMEVMYREKVA